MCIYLPSIFRVDVLYLTHSIKFNNCESEKNCKCHTRFLARLNRNSLNIYRNQKCFEQTLWRKIGHILCQINFAASLAVSETVEQKRKNWPYLLQIVWDAPSGNRLSYSSCGNMLSCEHTRFTRWRPTLAAIRQCVTGRRRNFRRPRWSNSLTAANSRRRVCRQRRALHSSWKCGVAPQCKEIIQKDFLSSGQDHCNAWPRSQSKYTCGDNIKMNSREIYCVDVNGGMAGVFADASRYEVCHFARGKMADNSENVNLQIRACFQPHRLYSVDAYASILRRRE